MSASERLRIDSGAGVVEVMRGRANNAEIEIGAGKAELRLELMAPPATPFHSLLHLPRMHPLALLQSPPVPYVLISLVALLHSTRNPRPYLPCILGRCKSEWNGVAGGDCGARIYELYITR
mgnify:CR=1 FL=1